jgi:hypothetical protein
MKMTGQHQPSLFTRTDFVIFPFFSEYEIMLKGQGFRAMK